jgi:16S rRNA (adenine1518-N6/adenine1519-N6)-dimethyltransferase
MSLLALSVRFLDSPSSSYHPCQSLHPQPKVDSAVVRVVLYHDPLIPSEKMDVFFLLARAGFSQKRKTLRNSISAGLAIDPKTTATILESANIDPRRRAETLSIEDWRMLTDQYLYHISEIQ